MRVPSGFGVCRGFCGFCDPIVMFGGQARVGKGNKQRTVQVPLTARQSLLAYLEQIGGGRQAMPRRREKTGRYSSVCWNLERMAFMRFLLTPKSEYPALDADRKWMTLCS